MKTFIETSKHIVPLKESIFDVAGNERVGKIVDKDLAQFFLDSCKGNFKTNFLKDGSVKINGKLIISNDKIESLDLKCKEFKGKLIIENCAKLKTLENSFLKKIAVFDASLTINNCPSLESLNGVPEYIKGDVMITNCKKIKDIGTLNFIEGNLYWSGNGKKYDKEQLAEKVNVRKIFCATEDIEANISESSINEALNNPWIQKLAAQLKKYPYRRYEWETDSDLIKITLDSVFGQYGRVTGPAGRVYDKITSEDVDVYNLGNESDRKELEKEFYNAYSKHAIDTADLILIFDEEKGEFVSGYGRTIKNTGIQKFVLPTADSHGKKLHGTFLGKTEAKQDLLYHKSGYTAVVIKSGDKTNTSGGERWSIHQERESSRRGMITPGDAEQYKQIALANIKRYKEIIANNKAKSGANEYVKLFDEVEKINTRVFNMTRMVAKDPLKYDSWKVGAVLNFINDTQRSNPHYRPGSRTNNQAYFGENGLMYCLRMFTSSFMDVFGGKDAQGNAKQASEYDIRTLKGRAASLKSAIEEADKKLKLAGF